MTRASQSCVCSDIKRSREIAGADALMYCADGFMHGNKPAGAPTSDSASFPELTHRAPVRHRIPEFPTFALIETWMVLKDAQLG
jgi:hypothetical protein